MISSILSPFWAVFVTLRKNMMNVTRYLLRFITVFKATTSDQKLFQKILKLTGDIPSQDQKKQADEGTCTGLILYGDTETVKQLIGDLLKVETIVHFCPLVSHLKYRDPSLTMVFIPQTSQLIWRALLFELWH